MAQKPRAPRISRKLAPPVVMTATTPLTLQGAARYIQAKKAEQAVRVMDRLAQRRRWPRSERDIVAYLGRSSTARRFDNLSQFWGYNLKNPGLFPRTWRFEPVSQGSFADLKEAADFAFRRCWQEATKHTRTFAYNRAFVYLYREQTGAVPKMLTGAATAVLEDPSAELIIVNVTEYASSLEAHAFQRARNGGIMYKAAQETARRYRNVEVRFSYTNLDKLGLPLAHKYAVPYIRVGLRSSAVRQFFSRPGRNIRRRNLAYKRQGGPAESVFYQFNARMNYARRSEAAARGSRGRIDDRHFGNDLYSYQSFRRRMRRKTRG
jgi:hypothetical protein